MDSGFRADHFALLAAFDGVQRDKQNVAQNTAYGTLVDAYEATAAWAYELRDRLFPKGIVRKLSKPTDRANKFKPYTWVRIYPRADAPRGLAYTVGLSSDGDFIVKLDTVNQSGTTRHRYMAVHGGDHRNSPIAATLDAKGGLGLSREGLVDWSIEAIGAFSPTYETLARDLGLTPALLRRVEDPEISHAGFRAWLAVLTENADRRGKTLLLADERIVVHEGSITPVATKLGLDPTGREWALEINEPKRAGDYNVTSAIAEDGQGARLLLRQGKLRGRPGEREIDNSLFIALTGLRPAAVDDTGRAGLRHWFVVANLDDPPDAIRRDTARFTDLCWSARLTDQRQRISGGPTGEDQDDEPADTLEATTDEAEDAVMVGPEADGVFTVGPRAAQEAREIRRRQGEVWTALAGILSQHGVGYAKWMGGGRYAIDMEIVPAGATPILLEIKSGASASELHTGVGQLYLYRALIRRLQAHRPVLLLEGTVPPRVKQAIVQLGIDVHTYRREEGEVRFSEAFLALCGVVSTRGAA